MAYCGASAFHFVDACRAEGGAVLLAGLAGVFLGAAFCGGWAGGYGAGEFYGAGGGFLLFVLATGVARATVGARGVGVAALAVGRRGVAGAAPSAGRARAGRAGAAVAPCDADAGGAPVVVGRCGAGAAWEGLGEDGHGRDGPVSLKSGPSRAPLPVVLATK